MTNREKILNTNLYDLLVALHEVCDKCIVNDIHFAFKDWEGHRCNETHDCKKCIADWLGEEAIT